MPFHTQNLDFASLIGAALSSPLTSLVIAVLIAGGMLLFFSPASSTSPTTVAERYAPEHRALRIVALGVICLFVGEFSFRGYLLATPDLIHWWRFSIPLAAGMLGLGIALGVIATRGSSAPTAPVVTATRRDWTSFSSRAALVTAALAALALAGTTIAAGLASSANSQGQHVWLAIPIANAPDIDPIRLLFFGWTYGVPVLICLVGLLIALWGMLARSAARPFMNTGTMTDERAERRRTATAATRIATAAMLLTLAGAWRLIAGGGSVSSLTILGQNGDAPYEAAWRYAELAVAAGWCAPFLEIIAFVLLLVTATWGVRSRRVHRVADAATDSPARSEATR